MVSKITDTESLRNAVRVLPEIVPHHRWDEHRLALRKQILNEDPNEFIKYSTVQATMFVGSNSYTEKEYLEIKNSPASERFSDFQQTINENWIGQPPPFSLNKKTSGNNVHQAYHLFKMIEMAAIKDIKINDITSVAEIGGGYGTMCWVLKRFQPTREYHLFDFQEMLYLQEYYIYRSGISENVQFHNTPKKIEVDLFISISALSEMPVKLREDYLKHIQARYYFIAYQNSFFDVDNMEFFSDYFKDAEIRLTLQHPYIATHNYMVVKV